MTPKNLMDDKQLNFNQPLLSVRRGSSTAHPEVETKKTAKPSPTIPPLPFYRSELKSGPVRNPGVVPFKWEQIPGKPKNERKLQNKAHEQMMAIKKVEKFSDKPSQESVGCKSRLDNNDGSTVSESSSMCKNGKEENDSSVSDGENSNYVDAVDSLSRSESTFLNCSVSGLDDSNTNLTETFSDPLSRDLMMGRFLPAAKAVASETPHFGIKKQQPVLKEQPREVKKDMTSDKQKIYYYAPISFPQRPQVKEEEEESEDEEEEDYDIDFGENENVSLKLCGLLPRFCLLNPIPGVRDQLPRPVSSARKIHKKPANAGAFSKTDKAIRDAVYERRRLAVYKKSDMRVDANRLKHELNELYPQIDAMRLKDALKCSSSEISDIPAKDSYAAKLTTRRKAQTKSPESLKNMIAQQEPALAKTTMEKTLYIDSAQMTEYRDSNSSSSESRSLAESRGRNPSIDYSFHDFKDLYSSDSNMILSQEHQVKDADVQQMPNKDDTETTMDKNPVLPLPLPKSPSESWLSRALPSVSSRNPRSYISTGNLGFRSSPVDPKWEAIANSSKHFGLPPLTPISEN